MCINTNGNNDNHPQSWLFIVTATYIVRIFIFVITNIITIVPVVIITISTSGPIVLIYVCKYVYIYTLW